jgi:hypothetical protein
MKRGEAIMAHLRDTSSGLARVPKHWLAWLFVAPLLIVTLPARSGASLDEVESGATAQPASAVTAPASVAPADPAVTPAAAIVTPAKPPSDDRQRRVLMLLLMNSAGPVRPYGNLGH